MGIEAARHVGRARASDADADGAPARCRGRRRCCVATSTPAASLFSPTARPKRFVGTDRAEAVVLADGRASRPISSCWRSASGPTSIWRATAKLDVNRGILVGDDMATSDPDIYAVGECIEHNGQVFGLVAPIWDQAKVCGARLAGDAAAVYVPPPVFTSLKITGIDVFSAGALAAADEADEEITLHDAKRGLYKKVILRDDRIVGSVLYGSVADGPWYVQLMRDKADVSSFRDQIVFGRAFAEQAAPRRHRPRLPRRPMRASTADAGSAMESSLIRTTCPYCGVGCGLRVAADGADLGRPGPPRQLRPALLEGRGARRHARYRRPTALSADRRPQCELGRGARSRSRATFTQTMADHGPDAVALYVSGQFLTEDYYVANKLMKGFIGSANIDTNSRLCMASSVAGHIRAFGEDIVPGCYDDIEAADLVVLVGSNTAWCHPVLYQRLVAAREKRGTKVVVDRSAAYRDLRHRRHSSGAPARHPMWRCSRACWCISCASGACDETWTRGVRGGFCRRRRGCAEVGAVARRRCGNRRCAGRRSRPVLRLVRRHRAHRDALFARHQPVLVRHRQGQRDHQLPSCDRPHRAAGHGAVLLDRPAERDGRPRGRRPCQPARRAYELRRPGGRRSRAPLLEGAAHGDPARPQGGRSVRSRARRHRSRRCGFSTPIRPSACRAPSACARRLAPARLSSSAIAGRPIRRALPISSCRRRPGARRTAPSPIRNAASRASAPSGRRLARRGRIGGCWPRSRGAWVGRRRLPIAARPRFSASTPRCRLSRTNGRTGASSISARSPI